MPIHYEMDDEHIVQITIDRPEAKNACDMYHFRDLANAWRKFRDDPEAWVAIVTGTGRAFCAGGDMRDGGATGEFAGTFWEKPTVNSFESGWEIYKPVIAAVNGFAIGGGHVLHVLCDLTIAADTAVFGQNGPRVGSFDAGFGTGYLARVVGEKRAREIWFLCRRYSAQQAAEWGLVNKVVPADQLKSEVRAWADEILQLSPTALRILKQSFNTDTEQFASMGQMAYSGLKLFGDTPEAKEGVAAFNEKRTPEFAAYRGN